MTTRSDSARTARPTTKRARNAQLNVDANAGLQRTARPAFTQSQTTPPGGSAGGCTRVFLAQRRPDLGPGDRFPDPDHSLCRDSRRSLQEHERRGELECQWSEQRLLLSGRSPDADNPLCREWWCVQEHGRGRELEVVSSGAASSSVQRADASGDGRWCYLIARSDRGIGCASRGTLDVTVMRSLRQ